MNNNHSHAAPPLVRVAAEGGKGRAFVLLHERGTYHEAAQALFAVLSQRTRALRIECASVRDDNWQHLSSEFIELMRQQGLKQTSFVSFGAAGTLLQDLGLTDVKQVRTAVFVDASTRPHPTSMQRFVDRVEEVLPLGLPLRLRAKGFDARAFLHRIRCPVLVVTTPRSTTFHQHQATVLADKLPTAWRVRLSSDEAEELCNLVCEFQDVPAKCPQKNVRAAATATSGVAVSS